MQTWFSWPSAFFHISVAIFYLSWFFGISLFDVLSVTIFKSDAMMLIWNCGISSLMFWLKIELRTWRQWIEPPSWSRKERLNRGRGDQRLLKNHRQKKNYHHEKQSAKRSFKADTIHFESLVLPTPLCFDFYQRFVLLLLLWVEVELN